MNEFKDQLSTDLKSRVIAEFLEELQKKEISEELISDLRIELSKQSISEANIRKILLDED